MKIEHIRKETHNDGTRRVWLGVIVLALSLALAMPAGAQKMKLIHWDWYEPRANLIKEFAARYHELNPDVEIETTLIPWMQFGRSSRSPSPRGPRLTSTSSITKSGGSLRAFWRRTPKRSLTSPRCPRGLHHV